MTMDSAEYSQAVAVGLADEGQTGSITVDTSPSILTTDQENFLID
jgi:hypothetical protein